MNQVYIAPRAWLDAEEAEVLEAVAKMLVPVSKKQHQDFADYTQGIRPYSLLIGVYLRLDLALSMLANYRSVLVEMVEDFEELGNSAVQLSETIKAGESILEQITNATANVFKIDDIIFGNEEYCDSLVEKTRTIMNSYQEDAPEEPDCVQLDLHL